MDTTSPTHPLRPGSVAATAGDWRLDHLPRARVPLLALAFSLGVHSVFLLAFNQHRPRYVLIPAPVAPPITNDWTVAPEPPPLTDPEVKSLDDPPAINVPRMLDTPSPVDVSAAFVQPLELPPKVTAISGDKVLQIPTHIEDGSSLSSTPVFDPKHLDRVPRAVAQPAPRFPREQQDTVSTAEVVVDFIVDTTGSVRSATIVSSTHPGFERAALDGVRQWKFRPGIKDGRKVSTRLRQPILFTLDHAPGT